MSENNKNVAERDPRDIHTTQVPWDTKFIRSYICDTNDEHETDINNYIKLYEEVYKANFNEHYIP